MSHSIRRFENIVRQFNSERFKAFAHEIRNIIKLRKIEPYQVYDEMKELSNISSIADESPPSREKPVDKNLWIKQQIAEIRRGKSHKQTTRFLRWMYFYAQPQVSAEWRDALTLPSTQNNENELIALDKVNFGTTSVPANLGTGLETLISLSSAVKWAELLEVAKRFEMRGLGATKVPKFALGSCLQIRIQPPMDGFISIFNLDYPPVGASEIFLLDPLFNMSDIVTYAGEHIVLRSATTGLPVYGLEGTSSILILCISEVSVFDLWGEHFNRREIFKPDALQLRQFTRRVLATDIRSRAITTIVYQT